MQATSRRLASGWRWPAASSQIGAAAIIANDLTDGEMDAIVDDLYARYAEGSGVKLIPEPATMALLGIGGLMVLRRRRQEK